MYEINKFLFFLVMMASLLQLEVKINVSTSGRLIMTTPNSHLQEETETCTGKESKVLLCNMQWVITIYIILALFFTHLADLFLFIFLFCFQLTVLLLLVQCLHLTQNWYSASSNNSRRFSANQESRSSSSIHSNSSHTKRVRIRIVGQPTRGKYMETTYSVSLCHVQL